MPVSRRSTFRAIVLCLGILASSVLAAGKASAQADPLVLGRAIDATVKLSIVVRGTVDGDAQIIWYAAGSGTIVSPDGLILTNQHLITPDGIEEKMTELEAELAGEGKSADLAVDPEHFMIAISDGRHLPQPRYVAAVVAEDAALDLAVLRIEGDQRGDPLTDQPPDLPVLPLGDSDALNLGDPVHVFGFPSIGSGSLTYTQGIVSGFLYEEGIDGTAWINTDAVTSGGNSGGAAMTAGGQLIGIPTTGAALDCRPGDTNRDGVEGPDDVGCVPTGGSLAQLRPINLAKPLLASVDPDLVATEAGTTIGGEEAPGDALRARIAAAEGCKKRGDWQCATNFYGDALTIAPADAELTGALYDAYLALGNQEEGAGRLESARSAYRGAAAIDPVPADAPAALERIARYRRIITSDRFDGEERYLAAGEGGATSAFADGSFNLNVSEPGLVTGYPLTGEPLAGQDFAALLRVGDAIGDGMVTIETRTDPDGGQYVFAVDPDQHTWEVLQFDPAEKRFIPWSGPYPYDAPGTSAGLATVELRVSDGFPVLLVNGSDVAAAAGAALPRVGNQGEVSFGALMGSTGEVPFAVSIEEVVLYELL